MAGLVRDKIPALKFGWRVHPTDILGGINPISGNVYWVKKSTDSDYSTFRKDHSVVYSNGTASLYNTIQAAVDAATDGGCETIVVCQGKWMEDVVVYGKSGLRILGAGYGTGGTESGGTRMRPSDATTKYPFTTKSSIDSQAAGFHIMSRNVEIAGFYFDGGGGYTGVYAGGGLNGGTGLPSTTANCSGLWVHDNFFRGGSEGQVGLYMNGVRFGAIVENNVFERWTQSGVEMDAGNASNEACVIRNNHFIADNGAYGVYGYAEANTALGCQVTSNVFADKVSHAFTYAVINNAGSTGVMCIAGNWFACTNNISALATDFCSGNYKSSAGNAETYVEEE